VLKSTTDKQDGINRGRFNCTSTMCRTVKNNEHHPYLPLGIALDAGTLGPKI